jgi:hypothetical protein
MRMRQGPAATHNHRFEKVTSPVSAKLEEIDSDYNQSWSIER